jgi:predicted nucleotidyltransferase
MAAIDLRQDWLDVISGLIATHLPNAEVLAYGSRVNGTSHEASDLDLVVRNLHDDKQPLYDITSLRRKFSESNLPITVDILDWAQIPEDFRQEILRSGTVTLYGKIKED